MLKCSFGCTSRQSALWQGCFSLGVLARLGRTMVTNKWAVLEVMRVTGSFGSGQLSSWSNWLNHFMKWFELSSDQEYERAESAGRPS